MLVDGKWTDAWRPVQATDEKGGFVRQISSFRNWVTRDGAPGPTGKAGLPAEAGRYHVFAALPCPWATRVLIARKLKRLESFVSVSFVEPVMTDQGWRFADRDALTGATYLHQIYTRADPHFSGRATVPTLWDKERRTIVNNESADIVRMFNSAFATLAMPSIDLYPADLQSKIDPLNDQIYSSLNNGVYRAGFATTQAAYEEAFRAVFTMLDALERRLAAGPCLFGERLTETDIRLFVTLARFDAAYHGLFKNAICAASPIIRTSARISQGSSSRPRSARRSASITSSAATIRSRRSIRVASFRLALSSSGRPSLGCAILNSPYDKARSDRRSRVQ